jgi:hypothetical protein
VAECSHVVLVLRTKLAEHMTCMEARRNVYRDLVVKPEGKWLLVRRNRRWERNVKVGDVTV